MSVDDHIEASRRHEEAFGARHDVDVVEGQQPGDAVDFVHEHHGRIEYKADLQGHDTGNIYVELRQTSNDGGTWRRSGLTLAASQADFIVYDIVEQQRELWLDPELLLHVVADEDWREVRTRRNVNGNRDGQYTVGVLVPITSASDIAEFVNHYDEE